MTAGLGGSTSCVSHGTATRGSVAATREYGCTAASLISRTADGIPYLQPEVVLLFKAKAVRPKDELDFAAVLPHLESSRRLWLRDALTLVHPGHAWLESLGTS